VIIQTADQHEALIQSLMDNNRWPDGGGERRRIDTHISTVVLAGAHAYKLKKPLDLGFLDFLSLESRHQACLEELRINRRLAPEIYQAVCAVTGSVDAPAMDGPGPVIDWAVRMQRFDPDAILSNLSAQLQPGLIDALAQRVAAFHAAAAVCPDDQLFGTPQVAFAPMRDNFEQIHALAGRAGDPVVVALQTWTEERYQGLRETLHRRKVEGHVRECHGDLHLGNVALIEGQPVVFDAIEFNPGFRWIDTINDVGFMTMDLHHCGRDALAYRFLDRYLQTGGDYAGLGVLQFYEVYRAMVRAKIAAIRVQQPLPDQERRAVAAELAAYIDLADRLTASRRGAVVIGHGVSGSGKSYVSEMLPGPLPAVRLRSDVERKRLLGIDPHDDATALGAYSADLSQRTYARLAELARLVVQAGYIAVVDATFLQRTQRTTFRELAAALRVPFVILDCDAPPRVLRERILRRRREAGNVSDADLQVLEMQLRTRDALDDDECDASVPVRPDRPLVVDELRQRLAE
jgi:aminoglycoside phosphotransferase family enzyme/predicted kinase